MKLKISLVSLLLTFVAVTFAQEAKTYSETAGYKTAFKHNSAGSNWFIQLGAGGQMLINDEKVEPTLSLDGVTLMPEFSIGKWFNPYLGFRLKGQGGSVHSIYDNAALDGTANTFDGMLKNKYINGHVDLLWNVSNYWGKYNSKRVFNFIPYVGLGYYYRDKSDQVLYSLTDATYPLPGIHTSENGMDGLSLNAGLMFQFRLSNHVAFHVDLAGMLVDDYFDRVTGMGRYDAVASASAGFTFNLGKTYFEVVEPMDYGLINDLNGKINALRSENEMLSKRPVSCPECPKVAPVTAPAEVNYVPNVVYFRLNSAVVDANQKISIYNTAQFMKNSGEKIKVVGYADKKTGTSAYNLKLSEQRAKAVAKELTSKYGISSDKIVVEWKGANEQPYPENNWNRVVIMSAQ